LSSAHALDPELTAPYKVQVVLHVAPNRLLTPIFREQLRRDLQQGLQAALGAMGEVEVFDLDKVPADKQEPLWKEVAAKGLQAGLDGPGKGTSAVKTHFVNVDYVDGYYELQARQYDGLTGMASPAVRHERTADRQFVARTAALLVDRDFGLVGTVTDAGDGKKVRVAFKGGGLKVPLDRWVKKGDVFALVQVGVNGGTVPRQWVLLQADEAPGEDGACTCKLWPPQKGPLTATGAGFRCIKLGTVTAPVRVRVREVAKQGPPQPPRGAVTLTIGRQDFGDDPAGVGVADDGFYSTEHNKQSKPEYNGVAFITVTYDGQDRARVPVALVDDRTIDLIIKPPDETSIVLQQRSLWERDLEAERQNLEELFKSLVEASRKPDRRAAALDHAHKELDNLVKNLRRYKADLNELAKYEKPAKGQKPLNLAVGRALLQIVQKGHDDLTKAVAGMDKAVKEDNSAENQEVLATFEEAKNLEKQADYGRAIELYEKVLAKTKDAKLEQRLAKLKEAWKPQSDEHRKAREFIYDTWPKLEESPAVMKERVMAAQKALAVCRKVKDPLGPRKLLKVALSHHVQLSKQLEDLRPTLDTVEADRKMAAALDEVLTPLATVIQEATAAVEQTPVP
jgi:hypothetical protein